MGGGWLDYSGAIHEDYLAATRCITQHKRTLLIDGCDVVAQRSIKPSYPLRTGGTDDLFSSASGAQAVDDHPIAKSHPKS